LVLFVVLLLGIMIIILGGWELVAPDAFDELIARVVSALSLPASIFK
jgi:hypothetical protein